MFNFTNNPDRTLFESVTREAIQIFGINIKYYITSFNENKEPIFAEDSKPLIEAEYKLKAYTQTIEEDWILTRFGLGSNDILNISIDIKEFSDSVGINPKPGDYVWIDYMSRLFIVTDVDKENAIFLQKKFVWEIRLKAADISGEEFLDSLNTITNYESIIDNINDNDAISQAVSGIVVEKTGDESIFGSFE